MVRYVSTDSAETIILGLVSAGRDISICVQTRPRFENLADQLVVRLMRVSLREGQLVSEGIDFQSLDEDCLSENKPGRRIQAHTFLDGQYSLSTWSTANAGFVSLFEHYIGKYERKAAKAVLGIPMPYSNMFTLEIRIQ